MAHLNNGTVIHPTYPLTLYPEVLKWHPLLVSVDFMRIQKARSYPLYCEVAVDIQDATVLGTRNGTPNFSLVDKNKEWKSLVAMHTQQSSTKQEIYEILEVNAFKLCQEIIFCLLIDEYLITWL